MNSKPLFDIPIPWDLEQDLHSLNPHWENKPGIPLPSFRRALFPRLKRLLVSGLTPAAVLRGPRRVGKTILMRQLIENLLKEGVNPLYVLYVPFDEISNLQKISDPVLAIARWFERTIVKRTFNEISHGGEMVYLFFDEVQNLDAWAPQVTGIGTGHL
jgi:predicted AAA+ superfamily ATPase